MFSGVHKKINNPTVKKRSTTSCFTAAALLDCCAGRASLQAINPESTPSSCCACHQRECSVVRMCLSRAHAGQAIQLFRIRMHARQTHCTCVAPAGSSVHGLHSIQYLLQLPNAHHTSHCMRNYFSHGEFQQQSVPCLS